jgi:hypothetical protein
MPITNHDLRNTAADLMSEPDTPNPEYDRALAELVCVLERRPITDNRADVLDNLRARWHEAHRTTRQYTLVLTLGRNVPLHEVGRLVRARLVDKLPDTDQIIDLEVHEGTS